MFKTEDFNENLDKEFEKLNSTLKKPNILLAGMTGVGKSSLINMVFGEGCAVVGTGKPVTKKMDLYESPDTSVRIFDSKGYEFGEKADKEFYDEVVNPAKNPADKDKAVHIVWYCISCSNGRVTEYDLKAIEAFHSANIPVAVIFTKADLPSEEDLIALKSVLPEWTVASTFETSTVNDEYNHLSELMDWSVEQLPEVVQESFIKAQKVALDLKWKKAHSIIALHATTAFGVGFVPIPVADAPILLGNEMLLLVRILNLYNLGSFKNLIKTGILKTPLTTIGKFFAGSLAKLIPGAGVVVGGTINGAVGAAITIALGEGVSSASCKIAKAKLENNDTLAETLISEFGNTVVTLVKEYIASGKTKSDDYSYEG